MFWIIQDDLFHENGRDVLINTLEQFEIPYQIVKIIPFSHELIPNIAQTENIITNGSILLSKIANERGWNPGGFLNDNFDYEVWYPYFKDHLLNKDSIFTTIKDADPQLNEFFIRPILDSKSFNGQIMTKDEFNIWKIDIINGKDNWLNGDIGILYSPTKYIGQEHRHYIVDKKVITSSRYKLNGRANYTNQVDQYIIDFAERMAAIYQPARAFVLDTYIIDNEIGIVELGCICNAGFYQADVQKLVIALDSMVL